MNLNYSRLFCICLISNLLFIYSMPIIGLGATSRVVIGEDDLDDLRKFEGDWLNDELDDPWWGLDSGDLDETYDKLDRHWDDDDACEPLYNEESDGPDNPEGYKDYGDYTYIDIFKIEVRDLDQATAKMIVRVKGDAQDSDEPWALFIWSDCSGGDDDDIIFVGIHADELIDGSDLNGYYVQQGDDNETGGIDYESDGSDIVMEFDSDMWNDVEKCNIYAIMITPKSDDWATDPEADVIIELFPKGEYKLWLDPWFWLWLLIICLIIIAACVLLFYWYKKNKSKRRSTKRI